MTEMLVLPIDLSRAGIRRLEARLERDIEAGADLGSRQGQIACLSGSILRSVERLREAVLVLAADLPAGDPMVGRLQEAAETMTRLAFTVVGHAAPYSPPARREG